MITEVTGVLGQRTRDPFARSSLKSRFAVDDDFTGAPVDVLHSQGGDLSDPQSEPHQQVS